MEEEMGNIFSIFLFFLGGGGREGGFGGEAGNEHVPE